MVGKKLAHYEIREKLGEGGMGEVYGADDTRLDRRVALKVLPEKMAEDPERLERFEREAKAVAALNHSSIVTIHSVEEADGHLELFPEEPRALYMGAISLAALSENERARDWAARALVADPEEPIVLYNIACTYARLGEIEKAIDCLDESITFGMGQKEWFEHDSDLDPLRESPRFQALLERL